MSAEPAASMAAATEPGSVTTETNIEATEAPSQTSAAPAPAPAPAKEEEKKTSASETPSQPQSISAVEEKGPVSPTGTPLSKLFAELPSIIATVGYTEMWGVELRNSSDVPTCIVLEKFLRANNQDVAKAKAQLIEALKWRKEVQPQKLLDETEFDQAKFGGLGFVTAYPKTESHEKEIVTWNIYGGVKDKQATFGDAKEFVKWRAALMEVSLKELNLASATVPIPPNGVDPYRMVQVHDYLNVSFLRMDPAVKAASKEVIQIFSMAYPELVKEKFFVNVPLVMGWVFAAMKLFLSPDTIKKFHPLSYGSTLAGELPGFGQELPVAYGGKGKDIKEGLTVKYAAAVEPPAEVEAK